MSKSIRENKEIKQETLNSLDFIAVNREGHVVNLNRQELQVGTVSLYGIHIVSLVIEGQERLCLAQISNTLLKQFSYNEIHNRRVALGITCVQCTPVQLEILRRAGAMPVSSRRCGMITRREAERLCKSFLGDNAPPRLVNLPSKILIKKNQRQFEIRGFQDRKNLSSPRIQRYEVADFIKFTEMMRSRYKLGDIRVQRLVF